MAEHDADMQTPGVSSTAEKLYEGALVLSEEARETLALRILDSIESAPRGDVAEAWRTKVVRRAEEVRRGEVETESWADVAAHLDQALAR